MIRYLLTFPIATKIIKSKTLTLNKPATKVSGSPTIGTQANSKDHFPNLLNHFDDLSIWVSLHGSHFFVIRFLEYNPINQLPVDPTILPRLAAISNNELLKFDVEINPANESSDENSKRFKDKKKIKNKDR